MKFLLALLIALLIVTMPVATWGYHEFKTPKKAFKKVTIEYYSDESKKTSPDSTVTIFYDKNDVEMHREVKKGCGNPVARAWEWDSLEVWQPVDSTARQETVWDLYGIQGHLSPSIIADSTITPIPTDEDWDW